MPEPYIRRSDLPYTASQIFSLFADEKVGVSRFFPGNNSANMPLSVSFPIIRCPSKRAAFASTASTIRERPKLISRLLSPASPEELQRLTPDIGGHRLRHL